MQPPDPFFSLPQNSEWNACIGKQGDEENYADGYIEAAIELAEAVIEKRMFEKRDTLVLPILYNARHAIELNLKLVIGELLQAAVINTGHPKNHDISSHFQFLKGKAVPDKLFSERLYSLEPFVDSLAQIDDDGQELRFHQNRDGQRSMAGKALANIEVIRESLKTLQASLNDLKHRAYSLCEEWRTGTRTSLCSRRDLAEITRLLPPRQNWNSNAFSEAKSIIKERYGLSNRQFSLALDKIQEVREFSGILGVETGLIYLSDEKAEVLIDNWVKLHPPRSMKESIGMDYFKDRGWAEVRRDRELKAKIIRWIAEGFSEEEFAEAETIFYLARDRIFSEHYEKMLERKIKEFRARGDLTLEINDLISKTNFRRCFTEGLRLVGRIGVSERLRE